MKQHLIIKASAALLFLVLLIVIEKWVPLEYLVLKIQNFGNGSVSTFKIGDAEISRLPNWMLSTSRESQNGKVTVFGFLPESLLPIEIDGPDEPFKSFVIFDNFAKSGQITYIETPPGENTKLQLIEESLKRGATLANQEGWRISSQNGLAVLVHTGAVGSVPLAIYSTNMHLTILLENVDEKAINQITFKRVHGKLNG